MLQDDFLPQGIDFQEYEEQRIHRMFLFISSGDPMGKCQTLGQALAEFDISWFQKRLKELQEEWWDRQQALQQEYEAQVEMLQSVFPSQGFNRKGLSPQQIEKKERVLAEERKRAIAHQIVELQEKLKVDLEEVELRFTTVIEQCQQQIRKAEKQFDEVEVSS